MKNVISIHILSSVITETMEALRRFGRSRDEGLVLWLGQVDGNQAKVTQQLVPPQNSIQDEHGVGYFVNEQTLLAINRYLNQRKIKLIAQVHSHPGEAYHSTADDRYAIVTKEGGVSLVVPNFASGQANLLGWAIYRLSRQGWFRLSQKEITTTFTVTEAGHYDGKKDSFSVII